MRSKGLKRIRSPNGFFYTYFTVNITQSRIDKGLIAIPRSLSGIFPDENCELSILFNTSEIPQIKKFSTYQSRTRENRIGGMAEWFEHNDIGKDDEIVIQLIDKKSKIYRILSENDFLLLTQGVQNSLDESADDKSVHDNLLKMMRLMNLEYSSIVLREYLRLAQMSHFQRRRRRTVKKRTVKEVVPTNIRILLRELYNGHCQLCDFTFQKKDRTPYFEIHHIDPGLGHHPKNLLSVCPNCHSQFEYSNVRHFYNPDNWLTRVTFNRKPYPVYQRLLTVSIEGYKVLFS